MVKKYIKHPIPIEAIRWTGFNEKELKEFVGDNFISKDDNVFIRTLEGDMLVEIGSYVIKGVEGEFYPCRGDIFKKTYEEVK